MNFDLIDLRRDVDEKSKICHRDEYQWEIVWILGEVLLFVPLGGLIIVLIDRSDDVKAKSAMTLDNTVTSF